LFVLKNGYFWVHPNNEGMKVQFKALPSDSPNLFPEVIFSSIYSNHPVSLVKEVVDKLDIDHILKPFQRLLI